VINALANSPWGVFTIGATIPITLVMGGWMFKRRCGRINVTGPISMQSGAGQPYSTAHRLRRKPSGRP